jgi:hypothetical protein
MKTREELINNKPCDFNCPPELKGGCCGGCWGNGGYWKNSEMEETLNEAEIEQIKEILKRPEGALGENGCELPRKLRSRLCLEAMCNKNSKSKRVTNKYY